MVKQFFIRMTLAAVFLALFSLKFVDVTIGEPSDEHPLEIAWKAIGIPLKELSTETWMQLNNRWMSIYELRTLVDKIKNELLIKVKNKPVFGEQDGINFASMEGTLKNGTLVTVTIQSSVYENNQETQLGINTSYHGTIKNYRAYIEDLKEKITSLGQGSHLKVLLSGEYKGQLRQEVIHEFSGRVFQKIKAELMESTYEAGNSNQKGYTGLIRESVKYDSRQVNVEIGTRYDSSRNITQIVLASPSLSEGS